MEEDDKNGEEYMARICLVEDEAVIRVYIEALLRKHHGVVGSTGSVDQALNEIPRIQPEVVLSDVILLNSRGDVFVLQK